MKKAEINQIVAMLVKALSDANSKPVSTISSYKAADKYEKKGKIVQSDRKIRNDVAVTKAFAKQGITVIPRQNVLTYKGWLALGKRVIAGQKGTYVKGVGTLFHSGQVAPDTQPTKAEMAAEVAAMQPTVQ